METKVLKNIDDLKKIATMKNLDLRSALKSKRILTLDDTIEVIKNEFPESTYTCQVVEGSNGEYELNLYCKNDKEELALRMSNIPADKVMKKVDSEIGIDDLINCLSEIIY